MHHISTIKYVKLSGLGKIIKDIKWPLIWRLVFTVTWSHRRCSYFQTPSSCPSGGVRISSTREASRAISCWMNCWTASVLSISSKLSSGQLHQSWGSKHLLVSAMFKEQARNFVHLVDKCWLHYLFKEKCLVPISRKTDRKRCQDKNLMARFILFKSIYIGHSYHRLLSLASSNCKDRSNDPNVQKIQKKSESVGPLRCLTSNTKCYEHSPNEIVFVLSAYFNCSGVIEITYSWYFPFFLSMYFLSL